MEENNKDNGQNQKEAGETENMIFAAEAGGFISEADILYYKGMGQRCDEIQEIMGRNPRWLTRWGAGLLVTVAVGFALLVWLLRVPETIDVAIHTTAGTSEIPVVSGADGTVLEVMTANGTDVERGDTLLILSVGEGLAAITAPASGTAGYTAPLTRGVAVKAGEPLMYVCVADGVADGPLFGYLQSSDARKVERGTEIYLDNGMRGYIESLSAAPHESGRYYFEMRMQPGESAAKLPREMTGKIRVSDERLIAKLWRSWRSR